MRTELIGILFEYCLNVQESSFAHLCFEGIKMIMKKWTSQNWMKKLLLMGTKR